jgi:DNA-binding MurR/RpiR family transcriptional regulator
MLVDYHLFAPCNITYYMSRELILAKLRSEDSRRTPSEQRLARYFEAHLDELPFETAASISKRVRLSAVTVGRFLRQLGYSKLTELTQELRNDVRSPAWQLKARTSSQGNGILARQLRAHIENLTRVFDQTSAPGWRETVALIASSRRVFVASFQNLHGIGLYFAAQLGYARPDVRFLSGEDGIFRDLFDSNPKNSCLVIVDSRRYARKAALLAERAKSEGVHVITVADIYCPWTATAEITLTDPGVGEVFWDSAVSTVALLELLLEAVIEKLGGRVQDRIGRITGLQDHFGDFSNG